MHKGLIIYDRAFFLLYDKSKKHPLVNSFENGNQHRRVNISQTRSL